MLNKLSHPSFKTALCCCCLLQPHYLLLFFDNLRGVVAASKLSPCAFSCTSAAYFGQFLSYVCLLVAFYPRLQGKPGYKAILLASLAATTEMSFNVPRQSWSWHLQNIVLVSIGLAAGRDFNFEMSFAGNNPSVLAVCLSPCFFTFVIFSYCDDMTNNETTSTASYLDPTL